MKLVAKLTTARDGKTKTFRHSTSIIRFNFKSHLVA